MVENKELSLDYSNQASVKMEEADNKFSGTVMF